MSIDAVESWHCIGPLAELSEHRPCWKRVESEQLAVVRVGDAVHALSDACPHQGASLAAGRVASGKLHCPAHGLGFDLRTGRMGHTALAVACFATEVRGADVWVRLAPGTVP